MSAFQGLEIHEDVAPTTQSALRGSQSLRLPRNLRVEVHPAPCLP